VGLAEGERSISVKAHSYHLSTLAAELENDHPLKVK
jgi:hypothetical protein